MASYVIYARKSSESEDRQVLSIDSQIRELKAIAQRDRVQIAEILTETRSAKAPGRPVFGQLMRRVNRGEVEGVFCWKMDRLSRNPYDSGLILQAQADGKLQRIVTSDGVKTSASNDRLMGTFELAFATKFIDDLRENTKRGLRERLSRGWVTYLPPIGYLNDPVTKTIVVDPKRFPLVRRMWDELLSGARRPEEIRRLANAEWGLRTRRFKRKGGAPLARTTVYSIFSNPFYMGVIQLKDGRRFPGRHQPMLTIEEFTRAQDILGRPSRQRPARHSFAFTGLVKCGNCGAGVTAEEHVKANGRRYVYYHCSRHRVTASPCHEPAIREPDLVSQLARELGRVSIPLPVLAWLKEKATRFLTMDRERQTAARTTVAEAIRSTEREQQNLLALQLRDLISVDQFATKNQELQERLATLQARQAKTDESDTEFTRQLSALLDFASNLRSCFENGTAVQQRVILEATGLNYVLTDRKVSFSLATPLSLVAEAGARSEWGHLVDDLRTWALNTNEYFRVPDFVHEASVARDAVAA